MTRINFMNTTIDNLTMNETLIEIDKLIRLNECAYVVTPNVDHIVQLERDEELKRVYENASLILADGKPLIWISKFYKTPIKEKISGSDLFPKVCDLAAKKGFTMYLLGAAEGVAAKAAKNLMQKYKGLNIVGTYSPPFGFEKDKKELDRIKQQIQKVHPDILIVGLGCPKQEKFMYHHCKELGVPISFGLGASIDFEAGNIKRAPKWMSEHGLEWLYRITQDPKRLAKRYLVDDMKIFSLAIRYGGKNKCVYV
ncbi:WecB/TagA/CpsF family glycosyltransferase [Holdemanella porci]|uniref:WecB/TagA/CpsF family glycosyltransferase n=1 Tax=Holdemanella porci TaxID=2652276 RepID=UPI003FD7BD06